MGPGETAPSRAPARRPGGRRQAPPAEAGLRQGRQGQAARGQARPALAPDADRGRAGSRRARGGLSRLASRLVARRRARRRGQGGQRGRSGARHRRPRRRGARDDHAALRRGAARGCGEGLPDASPR